MFIPDLEFETDFFGFYTDAINKVSELGQLSFPELIWVFIENWLWLVIYLFFVWVATLYWLDFRKKAFHAKREFVLLAIDVPVDNEQSPKAVENIFSQFTAILTGPSFLEKYIDGKHQEWISLEIVSIDGYVQFLIRINEKLRDVVEIAVYAQYPDCEITEIEDYVNNVPQEYPDPNYKLFGAEMLLGKDTAYPIKTYIEFEHSLSQELKDPMAALLETLGMLKPGEQTWLQICITPVLDKVWVKKYSTKLINKLLGKKEPPEKSKLWVRILLFPLRGIAKIIDMFSGGGGGGKDSSGGGDSEILKSPMLALTPGERDVVEAVERKASKMGFLTKFRLVYVGKKEVFHKPRGFASVFGAIRQFSTQNLNFFMPDMSTLTDWDYFFKQREINNRRNYLMSKYVNRKNWSGSNGYGFILNTEELASLYHFPMSTVKTPLLKRTMGKKTEPPIGLPVQLNDNYLNSSNYKRLPSNSEKRKDAPVDLTGVVTDLPIVPPNYKK